MKKVAFHNLGCKVNAYEMEYVQQEFEKRGYKIVPFAEKADIYVINTCTVTNIADRKSRQMLHRARKKNEEALVVAMGCYVQTDTEAVQDDPDIDLVVGNNHKKEIVDLVETALYERGKGGKTYVSDLSRRVDYEDLFLQQTKEHTRVSIKIQDGCDQFCAYCIIPYARGRARSRDPESVIREIAALAANGYREVVLTGIHLSSYGTDLGRDPVSYNEAAGKEENPGAALLSLIREVALRTGISRIRLGSLEPRIITDAFLQGLSGIDAFCDHFHLSLQSGSDTVLQRMNRHYDTAGYLEKVKLIRSYFPGAAIAADVIVGFPGETEEEFETTRRFLNEADLYAVHVFKYSRRKGTVADRMEGQLTERVKNERSAVLIAEGEVRTKRFMQNLIGQQAQMLCEETVRIGEKEYMTGFTKNYVRLALPLQNVNGQEMIRGTVKGFLTDEILEVSTEK
ncbi:MAG: tRNA (N(6)-L-threonylcarbamoyladenosine(37)-C(2))-methylthiotransferase MtaB [Lachnospiraceae bacterium]|nr:tRNA (N(6)-L-threonylcarbamoyladenosine(37)-C(2))-methylthiotransferase MtaB [Lachnospiraceae bacterium]